MSYSVTLPYPHVHERSSDYSFFYSRDFVYEISLRTPASSDWLKELPGAHRLVQTLLQGQILEHYHLLDFLIWPEGLFLRIRLEKSRPLSEFLSFLKERSTPAGEPPRFYWEEEIQWIRLIAPENQKESDRSFLERADQIRREVSRSFGFSPSLFFFYRDKEIPPSTTA